MRALALIAALAMVAGFFLPWFNGDTTGLRFVPWDLVKQLEPSVETAQRFVTESPPQLVAFLATFLVAAVFALLSLLGAPSRLLAFLAGGGVAGLLGFAVVKMKDQIQALGLPLPSTETMSDFAARAPEVFGIGAFAWAGGGVLLLLAALVGFGRR